MLLIVIFGLTLCAPNMATISKPIIVHTQYGDVLGFQTDLARVFYGIPFAQPPVDTLR